MNNILMSISLGLNLMLTTLITYAFLNIPYSLDLIRNTYIKDMRWTFQRACETGTEYPPEYRQNVPGFNENSTVNWCQTQEADIEQIILEGAFNLGHKK